MSDGVKSTKQSKVYKKDQEWGKTLRCQMGKENGDLGQIQDRETSSSYGE